jgi:hypothetical protein
MQIVGMVILAEFSYLRRKKVTRVAPLKIGL